MILGIPAAEWLVAFIFLLILWVSRRMAKASQGGPRRFGR